MEETVLCYLKKKDRILMLYRNKEKDDINSGKWIGVVAILKVVKLKKLL